MIETGRRFSAVDAFIGQYRLAELARAAAAVWGKVDVLLLPTDTHHLPDRRARGRADPAQQPARHLHQFRQPARPVRAGAARRLPPRRPAVGHHADGARLARPYAGGPGPGVAARHRPDAGCDRRHLPDEPDLGLPEPHEVELAVVGAHLSGGPLNHELLSADARLLRTTRTANCYRLYALAGTAAAQAGHGARPGRRRGRDRGGSVGAARAGVRRAGGARPAAAGDRHGRAGRRQPRQGLPVRGPRDRRGRGHHRPWRLARLSRLGRRRRTGDRTR